MAVENIFDELTTILVCGSIVITVAIGSLPWVWKKTIRPQKRSESGKTWEARKARRQKAK